MTEKLLLKCPNCKNTKFIFYEDKDMVECTNEICWYKASRQELIEQQDAMYGMRSVITMQNNSFEGNEYIKKI